ncbi:MAG: LD-carboxypeptidase [Synechococcaceae bacterium WBB_3_034]|jgi:muramoyltetrapeptide carboxypeptidase|nr:LD-carboxypeptidase [Synechococcaceae bacterium WBB_3_034]
MTPWPRPLQAGDAVQLAAASSALAPEALARLEAGSALLTSWGLAVQPHPDPLRQWGYLAGRDGERRGDLQPQTALVACLRGGWGAARLLELEGAMAAGDAPHWLLGFSDVTSLLWARQAAGIAGGIHGPMVTTLAAEPAWSQGRLRDLLFGRPLPPLGGDGWSPGVAEGPLLVGNLTVATHLLGTPHWPDLRGAVLVLEDIGEAPYRIDRMLTHWRLSGALQQLAGLAFGRFSDGEAEADAASDPADAVTVEQVLRERSGDLGIPVLGNLAVGHGPGNAALPLGRRVRLDAGSGSLELLEP